MDFIKKLYFSSVSFKIIPKEKLKLPEFNSATLRGGFGYSFKKIACIMKDKRECKDCILKENCPYFKLFESKNLEEKYKIEEIPKPFVIEPPQMQKKYYNGGESLIFNLILFGEAMKYFPYFFLSFIKLGEIGLGKLKTKFKIDKVREDFPNKKEIYNSKEENLKSLEAKEKIIFNKKGVKKVKLIFITPAKIKHNGKLLKKLDFPVLIETILRRAYLLSKFWCGYDGVYDIKGIIEKSKEIKTEIEDLRWHDFERFSTRQKRYLKFGGILGEINFEGNLKEFLPILKIGSIIHIGKNTSFGLGKYMLKYEGG